MNRKLACMVSAAVVASAMASAKAEKLRVVCTTTMILDAAKVIAGDHADLKGVMKPGEDPHVYDVRPMDVKMIASAQLIFMNGLHLEATLGHVIENNAKSAKVVALGETPKIAALENENARGAPDPHCWFNVQYFRTYAEGIQDALVERDPSHADDYRRNANAYIKQLDELHEWTKKEIATIPRERRAMVTSHDAFQYFGRTYFIDVYAVIGISTEQQPRPQDIAKLESIVRERGVKALFIETSVSQTLNDIVKKVADNTGAKIGGTLYSDSLGAPESPAATYIGMIKHNVSTVVEALK